MGGTQNAPCIGIVASRIVLGDTPQPSGRGGGVPEAVGAEGGRLLILWAPSSKRWGSSKDSGTGLVSGLGGGSASLSQDGI